ncbi:GTP-binding protein SAR1A, partial [Tanacetum coccineum]
IQSPSPKATRKHSTESNLDSRLLFAVQHLLSGQHQPTQHPTSVELSIGKIKFKAFDLGGHQIARRVWKDYYAKDLVSQFRKCRQSVVDFRSFFDAIHRLVLGRWMVDAYDKERFAESKKELDALLSDESLATVPFLILGNKIDIPYAASEDELPYYMGLEGLTSGKVTDGHTTAINTGGLVNTLVLRMLVDGNQPLPEKRQQAIESITSAINHTVERVKEALEKQRPPSPRGMYIYNMHCCVF